MVPRRRRYRGHRACPVVMHVSTVGSEVANLQGRLSGGFERQGTIQMSMSRYNNRNQPDKSKDQG